MRKLYFEIYCWIKHPDEINLDLRPRKKVQIVLKILLLEFLLTIPFLGLIYLIDSHIVKLDTPLDDSHPILILFFMVLAAPVIEEFIFRFPLKYKRNYLARLISFLSKGGFKKRWGSLFKYFLYLSAILFGLIHLPNFNNSEALFYVLPIIIGSQLIGGLILSYSRIKLGFVWSILQHSAFNLILIVLVILFSHNQVIAEESNEKFSIKIVEKVYVNKEYFYYKSKFKNDTIYSIHAKDISLSNLLDSLDIKGIKRYEDKWIDFKINSENGITRMELKSLLRRKIQPDQ